MNLRQLLYFRTVVEQGSLAAASEVLDIAQPPLSVAIKKLEAEWGFSLFERAGRGLLVTEAGLAVYDRACELLNHADQFNQDTQAFGAGNTGRVRIGFVSAGLEAVAQVVVKLRAKMPNVTFSLYQGEPRLLEEMIEKRAIDFALTTFPVTNPAFATRTLSELNFMAFSLRDAQIWPQNAVVGFADLEAKPLVILRRTVGRGFYERVLDELHQAKISPNVVADSSDVPAILSLVRQGIGIGILPIWQLGYVPTDLAVNRIVTNRPAESLVLVHGTGRRFLPVVHESISTCVALFA